LKFFLVLFLSRKRTREQENEGKENAVSTQIKAIDPHSPAERAGVRAGEFLTHVNGNSIVDVLDYKYYTYDPELELTLKDGERTRTVRVRKAEGEDLGLEFETYLMDKARSCANHCIFCFVDQMPPGMRDTLYFKDDDARLSFLMGNYITLTNLSQREIQRIIDLRISPINVSVHATDPELRVQMLKYRRAGESIDVMRRFAAAGIVMNCQVVSCPGVNDGVQLDRTMRDLAEMYPGVGSVSIVPVGLTQYRDGLTPLEGYTRESAGALLDQVEGFAARCKAELGTSLIWCSDEFYLKAERSIPDEDYYENFTQLENGVGMLRLLESEFRAALLLAEPGEGSQVRPFAIADGVSAAPWLKRLLDLAGDRCGKLPGQVYPIVNRFFGETITVSGLVTGRDLIEQLRGKDLGERLLLPSSMLKHQENVFLDDVTLAEVEEALGVPVVPVEQDGGALADAIFEWEQSGDHGDDGVQWVDPEDDYYPYNPPHNRDKEETE
jgi:putative radical SAM enzyme (TIGR03279 family)